MYMKDRLSDTRWNNLLEQGEMTAATTQLLREPSTPLKSKRIILLVEDDALLMSIMEALLTMAGYRVIKASDGGEALQLYEEFHQEIDLVLSDMGLPVLDGSKVLEGIRAMNARAKVVMISAHIDDATRQLLLEGGALDCLRKPYDPRMLLLKIKEYVGD